MYIPLDVTGPNKPAFVEKARHKQGKAYQDPDEIKTHEETMSDINNKLELAYRATLDEIKRNQSS